MNDIEKYRKRQEEVMAKAFEQELLKIEEKKKADFLKPRNKYDVLEAIELVQDFIYELVTDDDDLCMIVRLIDDYLDLVHKKVEQMSEVKVKTNKYRRRLDIEVDID